MKTRSTLFRLAFLTLFLLLGSYTQLMAAESRKLNAAEASSPGSFFINAGLNDAWYNADTTGQGFFFTVLPANGLFFLSWFTYDTERPDETSTAILGDAGQRWLTAIGAYELGNTVTLDVELTTGGVFNSSIPAVQQTPGYGTITIVFDNCRAATLGYEFPQLGLTGEIDLSRVADDNVSLCQRLNADVHRQNPRGRPHIDQSLGYNLILSDLNTTLRGVSLSLDGGDPYGSIAPVLPSQASLNSLASDYGFNLLHVYLEGDAGQNPDPVGINEKLADILVERTAIANLYLMITMGNNGENGAIHSMQKTLDFWSLYADKYADETHVLFEAHNEPVTGINDDYTVNDWNRQVQMYQHIRSLAPDSMILLGSFMSFYGATAALNGADYIREQTGDPNIWDNAAFAWHGYWDLPGIESTINFIQQAGLEYPALFCTEFWPGDTQNGFNAAIETHHMGWAQFQWLNAQDLDLDDLKNRLDKAGTVWRPEAPGAIWPTAGQPAIPAFGTKIGIFSHYEGQFVTHDGTHLRADSDEYSAFENDSFTVVDAGNGFVALQTDQGKFVSANGTDSPLTVRSAQIGINEMWEWLELCPEQGVQAMTLRPWGGGGHLVGILNSGENRSKLAANADDASYDGVAEYGFVTAATSFAPQGCEAPPPPSAGPFYGSPMVIPTDPSQPHPFNPSAPVNVIYASDFDHGGEGVAYHDIDDENRGGVYRFDEGVDIEAFDRFTNVGWIEPDEWLNFAVDVQTAGHYTLSALVASAVQNGSFHIEMDGLDVTGQVPTPHTGAWDNYVEIEVNVTLNAGVQELRMVSGGGFNLISLDIRNK